MNCCVRPDPGFTGIYGVGIKLSFYHALIDFCNGLLYGGVITFAVDNDTGDVIVQGLDSTFCYVSHFPVNMILCQ